MRIVMGSRERLADVLRELAEGWGSHLGNERQAISALSALDQLRAGETVVQVGHTEYRVKETDVL